MERNYLRRLYKKRPPNVSARVDEGSEQTQPKPQIDMTEEIKKPEPVKEPVKEPIKEKEAEIVTIHDFKSMLIGMDLVLGDNWTPTEQQWGRIRKKLDALIETAERPRGAVPPPSFQPVGAIPVDPTLNVTENDILRSFPDVPAAEDIPIGQPGPAGQSALAPPARVPQATPSVRPPMSTVEGEQVKTPDIDSSQGYKSSFV